ncbi:hypothetical protein I4U23_008798 [Adineta vaga]|nr:hypothetical protein I4U23_008798 [Adineta vaga]
MNMISFGWLVLIVTQLTYLVHANWVTGNLCWSMPCLNGGSCFGSAYTYLCICPVNYSGALCERRLGICQESPCGNRGVCVETSLTSFECRCYFDYMGPLCEEHVSKKDPFVWSSLIPVHTRVLFDILQEAYRAKAHGRSANNPYYDPLDFSRLSFTHSKSPSSVTTLSTTIESTSVNPQSQTTEYEHIIQAEHIQLEKIFPDVSTVSTSNMYTENLSTQILQTTQRDDFNNETISSTSYETQTMHSSMALSEEDISTTSLPLTTITTTIENMSTISLELNETISLNITENQEFLNTTEQSEIMVINSTYFDQSSYNSDNSTIMYTTDITDNSTEQTNTINTETEVFIMNTTPQFTSNISLEIGNYSLDQNDTNVFNTTEQTTASTMVTTDQSSHSQLLYKLCQQLLSHILPNISSTTAVEAALSLTAELPSTGNNSANALLSWIQEKFSTSSPTSATTMTQTTEASSSSSSPSSTSLSSLLTNGRKLSLQRVDMDDILYDSNDNIDDEHSK